MGFGYLKDINKLMKPWNALAITKHILCEKPMRVKFKIVIQNTIIIIATRHISTIIRALKAQNIKKHNMQYSATRYSNLDITKFLRHKMIF